MPASPAYGAAQIVEWAFGKRMTPAERLRKHQRALERTQRELDRERVKLENQEKKLVQDIKKSAKNGQMGACKIQAKDLVRTRRCVLYLRWGTRYRDVMISRPLYSSVLTHPDISRNSTRCAPNYKRSLYESRWEITPQSRQTVYMALTK